MRLGLAKRFALASCFAANTFFLNISLAQNTASLAAPAARQVQVDAWLSAVDRITGLQQRDWIAGRGHYVSVTQGSLDNLEYTGYANGDSAIEDSEIGRDHVEPDYENLVADEAADALIGDALNVEDEVAASEIVNDEAAVSDAADDVAADLGDDEAALDACPASGCHGDPCYGHRPTIQEAPVAAATSDAVDGCYIDDCGDWADKSASDVVASDEATNDGALTVDASADETGDYSFEAGDDSAAIDTADDNGKLTDSIELSGDEYGSDYSDEDMAEVAADVVEDMGDVAAETTESYVEEDYSDESVAEIRTDEAPLSLSDEASGDDLAVGLTEAVRSAEGVQDLLSRDAIPGEFPAEELASEETSDEGDSLTAELPEGAGEAAEVRDVIADEVQPTDLPEGEVLVDEAAEMSLSEEATGETVLEAADSEPATNEPVADESNVGVPAYGDESETFQSSDTSLDADTAGEEVVAEDGASPAERVALRATADDSDDNSEVAEFRPAASVARALWIGYFHSLGMQAGGEIEAGAFDESTLEDGNQFDADDNE